MEKHEWHALTRMPVADHKTVDLRICQLSASHRRLFSLSLSISAIARQEPSRNRHAAGAMPTHLLNARLNAASES
jgi:hypothetical protein